MILKIKNTNTRNFIFSILILFLHIACYYEIKPTSYGKNMGISASNYAIMYFEPIGIDYNLSTIINEKITNKIIANQNIDVIDRSKIIDFLNKDEIDFYECTDSNCATDVAKYLDIDYVIIGTISKYDKAINIDCRIVNVLSLKLISSASITHSGNIDDLLTRGIDNIYNQLFPKNKYNNYRDEYRKNKPKRKPADPNYIHFIESGDSPFVGSLYAPVTIIKFFDFQCPYSARAVSLEDEIISKFNNKVKIVYKSFPLGSHKQARKAAKYALAANKQGKFKEMYDLIFANYRTLKTNEDLPLELARNIGLDLYQLNLDMNSPELEYQIEKEYNQLKSLKNSYENNEYSGVRLAVPKFFINGREPEGRSLESFSKVIEEELKKHY